MAHEIRESGYRVSDDPALLNVDAIHAYLARSYWSPGIPRATVERAIRSSLCFGVYPDGPGKPVQIGFGRAVTDCATFAYLADIYILEEHRGCGLSKLLMRAITSHPELQGLRRWLLMTRDAHGLYEGFGFKPLRNPGNAMERHTPGIYQSPSA